MNDRVSTFKRCVSLFLVPFIWVAFIGGLLLVAIVDVVSMKLQKSGRVAFGR
ncbi:MAG: hypothetical protein WCI36_03310 [bacterium]